MPSGADGATGDRRRWSGLRSRSPVTVRRAFLAAGVSSRARSEAVRCCSQSPRSRAWRGHGEGRGTASRSKLVAHAAVETLAEDALHRLAWRDLMPGDAFGLAPGEDGVRGELRAIVGDDRPRFATPRHERRQFADHALAGDQRVGDREQALACRVVDHVEDPETPSAGELVVPEVEQPARSSAAQAGAAPAGPRNIAWPCACAPRDFRPDTAGRRCCGSPPRCRAAAARAAAAFSNCKAIACQLRDSRSDGADARGRIAAPPLSTPPCFARRGPWPASPAEPHRRAIATCS